LQHPQRTPPAATATKWFDWAGTTNELGASGFDSMTRSPHAEHLPFTGFGNRHEHSGPTSPVQRRVTG
jgi:hypothetical protein